MGDKISMTLPTRDIVIQLMKTTKIKVARQQYDAYYMESNPAQYKVWFDSSPQKIPLRINGAVGLADTAIIMTDYQP